MAVYKIYNQSSMCKNQSCVRDFQIIRAFLLSCIRDELCIIKTTSTVHSYTLDITDAHGPNFSRAGPGSGRL